MAVGFLGFRMIKQGNREALYTMFAWFPFLSTGMVTSPMDWGDIPVTYINTHIFQFGAAIEALLLSWVISRQILKARQEKTEALQTAVYNERQASIFKEQALTLEREMNIQLERRVKLQTQDLTRLVTELEKHNIALTEISINDALTQVRNRRFLDEQIPDLWDTAYKQQKVLSMIMLDADHFKAVNDTYGHSMGDECLRTIGSILRQHVTHAQGFPCRYGGEEFINVLPGYDLVSTRKLAEAIRKDIEQTPITLNDHTIMITVSLGVASILPEEEHQHQTLIDRCDQALYKAKKEGRNKVIIFADAFKIAS